MTAADRERWDAKYAGRELPAGVDPPDWLVAQASALPPGRALDLACGLGHTAIWLAQRGWNVTALDVSPVGLKLAERLATQCGVPVDWRTADLDNVFLDNVFLDEAEYDLITVFRFLDRNALPSRIIKALKPGGRLLYETFLADESLPPTSTHVRNPAFVLRPGELPRMFSELQVIGYAEVLSGADHLARLSARK